MAEQDIQRAVRQVMADVLDLGDVREAATLARQGRGREQLEGRVLGPADLHGALERHAALDQDAVHGR